MKRNIFILKVTRTIMPIVGIICIVAFLPWDGIWAWVTPLPGTIQEQVDDAIGHGLDGVIVYVGKKGEPSEFYTSGWKNRENKIPADPQSLFKIGSISKLYVAAAVAKLVHSQKLSLEDTLADHFPKLVGRIENAETITLRLMLQHRSGIPNLTDTSGFSWSDPPKTNEASLALVLGLPADFEPNEEYSYSNTNYLLLAETIDKILGYGHFKYIRDEILIPLGLKNTHGSLREVNIDDVMSGYYVGWGPDLKNSDRGMMATAEDVGVFLRALNDGTLFNDAEQEIYSSIYVYEHTGWVPGYYSISGYLKDIDTVVVQFVSTNGGTPLVQFFDTRGGTKVMVSHVVYDRVVRILREEGNVDE